MNGVLPPQLPVVEAPPGFDVGEEVPEIIHEWRDEISSEQVRTDYASQLALRAGGRDLTEGAFLYKRGHLAGDARSFNRALGIFANLLNNSADPLVALIARAYLQLAYYRSGRLGKVPSMDIPPLPEEFSRLEAEMHGLAWMCGAEQHALGSQDGLGFSDISPLDADRILEDEIQARIVTPSTPLASEPRHDPPTTEETYESESEKLPARNSGPSALVSVRPARNFITLRDVRYAACDSSFTSNLRRTCSRDVRTPEPLYGNRGHPCGPQAEESARACATRSDSDISEVSPVR